MEKVVIDVIVENNYNAGSKARKDVNQILQNVGFNVKYVNSKSCKSKIDLYNNVKYCYKQLCDILDKLCNDSILVFQFPWDSLSLKFSNKIKKVANDKNINTIVVIHDLVSIRTASISGKLFAKYYVNEKKFLNNFDFVICHNEKMKEYLKEIGVFDEKIVSLGIFDYLACPMENTLKDNFKIVNIAGNLSKEKSKYIYQLNNLYNKNYEIHLYGNGYDANSNAFIKYMGKFLPDKLPVNLTQGFGLVWDGESIETCNGNFGQYLKWNNPHKFSLYMACGIPVIIWKQAALASFVEQNSIGITINSLIELNDILKKINYKDYQKMKKNVKQIQTRVLKGQYLLDAIKKTNIGELNNVKSKHNSTNI